MSYTRYFIRLCAILLIKGLAVLGFILYGNIGLGPDEAQYWTWSRDLSLGYYSKPPGIAWLIWAGTQLFGHTELGVRAGALLMGTLLPIGVFGLARVCALTPRACLWSGIVMALTPIGLMASFLAITDGGVVLFWILSSILIADSINKQRLPNYWLLSLLIIGGALFKWWIYYFWIVVLASMAFYPFMINWRAFAGMIISLLGLAPSIIWNSQHDWVTFRHVFATIRGGGETSTHVASNFWGFLGEQVLLLSPLLFLLLLFGFYRLIRNREYIPHSVQWCGWSCFVILIAFCSLAIFKKMQGNWCAFAYPMGIVFLCWYAFEGVSWKKYWLQGGLSIGVLASVLYLFAFPFASYKKNPFRHNLGWIRLRNTLSQIGYDPEDHFLFGDKYQTSSLLSFYSPGQKRAYFLNLHGTRKNQFSFWPSMSQEQLGATGYFVAIEHSPQFDQEKDAWVGDYQHLLKDYFDEVWLLGITPIHYHLDHPVKGALIFKCVNYNGKEPPETNLY